MVGFALPPQLRKGGPPDTPSRRDSTIARMQKKNLENMNRERFLKIKQDSEKLLELATELRAEMDDADENILSVKVIRNAEAIERLAKSIREKMSEHIGPGVE
jgi:hypothetical protein